jgi:hypothetical protein
MENQEVEQKLLNSDEQLFISAIMRSDFFKNEMKKAFMQGIKFEQIETDGDMNVANINDKHLPFYEWFAKYYI